MTYQSDCLASQPILVTGASSGIGRATAVALSKCGARLVLVGRHIGRLEETALTLQTRAMQLLAIDLADDAAIDDAIKQVVLEHGPLHGVFHSAGTGLVMPARLTNRRQIDEVFGASVYGGFGIARAASRKGTIKDGGSLVFMSSIMSRRGRRGLTAYAAAKAAISGMVRALAVELAPRRIRVNAIAAGAVGTSMHDEVSNSLTTNMMAEYEGLHPLGFGTADDVANAALFLFSNASKWITGSNLAVDGGYAAK